MTEIIATTGEFAAPDASTRVEGLAPPSLETQKVKELASDQLGKLDNMLRSFELHEYSDDEADQELVAFYLSLENDDKTPEDLKLTMKAAALGSITSEPRKDFATSRLKALFELVSENESDDWVFGNLERSHKLLLEQDGEERVLDKAKQLSFINGLIDSYSKDPRHATKNAIPLVLNGLAIAMARPATRKAFVEDAVRLVSK